MAEYDEHSILSVSSVNVLSAILRQRILHYSQSFLLGLLLVGFASDQNSATDGSREGVGRGIAAVLTIAEAIGPATKDYVGRSFSEAQTQGAEIIVIRMDTPGGLDGAMRDIIKLITASPVPVATYVAPTGARAASAGTYILYASHIAAMAPGTNLGAATPVQIGGIGMPGEDKNKDAEEGGEKPSDMTGDAMKRKMINDASAYIRGLAELHGRNADWAELAVREAVSLEASEAIKINVINLIAKDINELLEKMNGLVVTHGGSKITLRTAGLRPVEIEPDWRNRLLSVLTNPNVAYILMMVGVYGLLLEFYNPGGLVPGVVGAICLLLALYSFQLLPVNYAGVALIILGVGLMVAEAFQPSFGMLGIGGVVAFVIGSIILMDTDLPDFRIYLSVVAAVAGVTIVVLIAVIGLALRARSRPVVSGAEQLIGQVATVSTPLDRHFANVRVHSELWRAHTSRPLKAGEEVKVTAVDGLTLEVEPVAAEQPGDDDENLDTTGTSGSKED